MYVWKAFVTATHANHAVPCRISAILVASDDGGPSKTPPFRVERIGTNDTLRLYSIGVVERKHMRRSRINAMTRVMESYSWSTGGAIVHAGVLSKCARRIGPKWFRFSSYVRRCVALISLFRLPVLQEAHISAETYEWHATVHSA